MGTPLIAGMDEHLEAMASERLPIKALTDIKYKGLDSTSRTVMQVAGICCPSEVPLIERLLKPLAGVKSVQVNVTGRLTIVVHDSSLTPAAVLVNELNGADLGASIQQGEGASESKISKFPPVPVIIIAALFLLSLLHNLSHIKDVLENVKYLEYVSIACIAIGLPGILKRAFTSLRVFVLDVNMLMSIAVVGAMAITDFEEAAAVVLLFSLSECLET